MGQGQVFTAVYAEGGICGIPPHDLIGCNRLAATFYVVPVATDVKTVIYMGLHAIPGVIRRWYW
eukprot:2270457-Pleurochrysis_carterae.AAC.2